MKIEVYEYKGCGGIRDYTFLVDLYYESNIRVKGRKRVRLERLFNRTKLEARNRFKQFLVPDKRYSFYVCNRSLGV